MDTLAQHIAEAWRNGESNDELVAHLGRLWPSASYFSLAVCSSKGYLVSSSNLKTGRLVLSLLRPQQSIAGTAVTTKGWSTSEPDASHSQGHKRPQDVEAAARHFGVQVLHSCPILGAGAQGSSGAVQAVGAILLGHSQRLDLQESTKHEVEQLAKHLSGILPDAAAESLRSIDMVLFPRTLAAATRAAVSRRVHTSAPAAMPEQHNILATAWGSRQCSSAPDPRSGSGGAGAAGGGIEVQTAAEAEDAQESSSSDMVFAMSQGRWTSSGRAGNHTMAEPQTGKEKSCAAGEDEEWGADVFWNDKQSGAAGGDESPSSWDVSKGKRSNEAGSTAEAPRQHWLWDSFEDPRLEKTYRLWHAEHVVPYDVAASLVLVAMCLPLSYGPMHLARTHPLWLTSVLPQLARLLLIRFRRRWYVENRELLVAVMAVHFWVHCVLWSGVQMAVLARYSPARAVSDPLVFNRVSAAETTVCTMIVHPMHLPESVALLAAFLGLALRHVATRLCPVLPLPGWLCLTYGAADLLLVATAVPLLFARWNSRRLRRTFLLQQAVSAR